MTDYVARLAETPAELEQVLLPLIDAGVDVIDTSTRRFWEPEFADSDMNIAGWAKKITGKPTITVGSIGIDRELDVTEFDRSGITKSKSKANSAMTEMSLFRLHRLMEMFHRGDFRLRGRRAHHPRESVLVQPCARPTSRPDRAVLGGMPEGAVPGLVMPAIGRGTIVDRRATDDPLLVRVNPWSAGSWIPGYNRFCGLV